VKIYSHKVKIYPTKFSGNAIEKPFAADLKAACKLLGSMYTASRPTYPIADEVRYEIGTTAKQLKFKFTVTPARCKYWKIYETAVKANGSIVAPPPWISVNTDQNAGTLTI
jgi:hypothetical protein